MEIAMHINQDPNKGLV